MKARLDTEMVRLGLVATRSQAESYIKLGQVTVNGKLPKPQKPGFMVEERDAIRLTATEQYVSRAGLKLASVAEALYLQFDGKTVLDVGSSTGGFTEYALKHGAQKVIAVELGTDQLHPSLRQNPQIELHEKTDIRKFRTSQQIDLVLADVSFISLREILPSVSKLCTKQTRLAIMVKPQFEAGQSSLKHKGVIKNDKIRREILKDFETWVLNYFQILNKADSAVSGSKGNKERFYLLKKLA
ncbi:MAG: TlyA family RNA methyltransferase [Candidatus Saccharimonadales bacterium]